MKKTTKAVILAGGRGTRMGSLTDDCPKPLIDINGYPFLAYVLESLSINGIDQIAIVTGYKHEKIIEFVMDCNLYDYFEEVTLVHQKEQLGTGHALSLCESFVHKDNFILLNGDSLFSASDIYALTVLAQGYVYVCGQISLTPERYGVLRKQQDREILKEIVEKPTEYISSLVNTGLYKLDSRIFSYLRLLEPSPRGELELPDAINLQAKNEPVFVYKLQDYWLDFGCPEDIQKVEEHLNELNAR